MKITKLKTVLKTPRGEPILITGKTVTLSSALEYLTDTDPPRDVKTLTAKERDKLYALNKRLAKDPEELIISSENITLLMELAAFMFNSQLYGVFKEFIDPEEVEENESLTPTEE